MELLDRYRPLFLIGKGGMGTIEVAVERGRGDAGRVVALKRMLPGVRDRNSTDMFMREARLATLLNHDNVVHAFAFGEHDGELFIAMEYVEGQTLASLQSALGVHDERLPVPVLAYIFASLCDGLHAAHEVRDVAGRPLGLVHRDVSPQNVMLSYRGEVKLLDFGVAKLESTHLTKTGEVKGKAAYMSPEQALGDPLDRRSDLYSVGAILFEMLAGRRMYTGQTDLELLRQLALAEPPSLAEAAPDAPAELVNLQARLVAKHPKDRPATALEVANVFRMFASESRDAAAGTLARMLDAHFAEQKWTKRHQLEAALAREAEDAPVTSTAAPPTRVRAAPWVYALVGAAVASVAVLGLARTQRPAVAQSTPGVAQPPSASAAVANAAATSTTTETVVELPNTPSTVSATLHPPLRVMRAAPPPHNARDPKPAETTSTAPSPSKPPLDVDPHAI